MGFVDWLGNPTPWIPAFAGMTAFSSGIGKLFVMPGRQVIRHSRVGTLFVISESASYSSFRGGVAEPGIHGVCRLAGKPNPMDSRFRGNDGVIQGFLRSKWIPAFAAMTDLFKASLSKCHSHQQVPLQPSRGRPQVPLNLRAFCRHRNRHLFGQGVLQRRQQGGQLRLQQRHAARHRDLAGFSVA